MNYIVAADIMSKNVICVLKDADLRDLGKLFLARGITGAPVIDRKGDLCGVISQTDLLHYQLTRDDELVMPVGFYENAKVDGRSLQRGYQIEDVNTATVEEVMTPVVHTVSTKTPIATVARLMTRRHIHRVIVRSGRKVAGIISTLDVLRVIGAKLPERSKAAHVRPAGKSKAKPRGRTRPAA
jgi:CBS domain-containing protein